MNEIINWDFAPKQKTMATNKDWCASVYYQPRKKTPTYTMQMHSNAPKRLLNAEYVSFGLMNGSIVVTDSDKGIAYKVRGKNDGVSAQINGKALTEKIAQHFHVDNGTNMKMRLNLIPIGSPDLRLWEIKLYRID
jgi:hypothetical protein